MAFKNPFKTFLLISILSIILTLILIWGTSQVAPGLIHYRTLENAPYAKVESINVQPGGVTVVINIIDPSNWSFTPTGGWVEILGTGQVGNMTIVSNGSLIIHLPLIPQYLTLSSTGIRGLIRGYLNGNPAYIAFFDVAPIHVINSVTLVYANYTNCDLTISINYSTLVPAIVKPQSISMFTKNTIPGYLVFDVVNPNITIYVPQGIGVVNVTIPIRDYTNQVYYCNLRQGLTYILYMPVSIAYVFPSGNITQYVQLGKEVVLGDGS